MKSFVVLATFVAVPLFAQSTDEPHPASNLAMEYIGLCEEWVMDALFQDDSEARLANSINSYARSNGMNQSEKFTLGTICGAFVRGMAASAEFPDGNAR